MKPLICIPTYNEVDNICRIINAIDELELGFDILVVDDESPDGTGDAVDALRAKKSHLNLIRRKGKRGLAGAYIEGFRHGLRNRYDFIGEMDADFSHAPDALRDIRRLIDEGRHDVIIGSRYVAGGSTRNWGFIRKCVSQGGSLYARLLLGLPIRDLTGGFNFWSYACLDAINIDGIVSEGYVFQIELKAKACLHGFSYIEWPITFEDRRVGQSKMSRKIVFEAMYKVLWLRKHLK